MRKTKHTAIEFSVYTEHVTTTGYYYTLQVTGYCLEMSNQYSQFIVRSLVYLKIVPCPFRVEVVLTTENVRLDI